MLALAITGGVTPSFSSGVHNVPKTELLSKLRIWIETGVLEVAAALPHATRLRDELLNLRRDISRSGETFEPAHSRQHDDLVMALALACWFPRAP
ncbi:MAG: hypothetical protein FJW39_31780 [Acidobacteria bacterium]|nr:hypothetical protein [Acidobacteriota bacterium]